MTALAATADTVYAAGFFGRIGSEARRFLAALDGTTGAATAWNPDPNNVVTAVVPVGGIVYVGGRFSSIGGATRRQIAAVDAVTGAATAWNPNATLLSSNTAVDALAVVGNTVYAGGSFDRLRRVRREVRCDENAADRIARVAALSCRAAMVGGMLPSHVPATSDHPDTGERSTRWSRPTSAAIPATSTRIRAWQNFNTRTFAQDNAGH